MADTNPVSETYTVPQALPQTRGYQQEMLDESLRKNIIIALDTGSGKTHIAVLRMKIEAERESKKVSWFLTPTVALCRQQHQVISRALPVSVGMISGASEPDQWKDHTLWQRILEDHRIMVSTPQVLLDALSHGYIDLGRAINLIVFDEAHRAVQNAPYNEIMKQFYFDLPPRPAPSPTALPFTDSESYVRPMIMGLTASPIFGGDVTFALAVIEKNLDCTVVAPSQSRQELAKYVHRPAFKYHIYPYPYTRPTSSILSPNLLAIQAVVEELDIENDPYVKSLRARLSKIPDNPSTRVERSRLDQKLSKTIRTQNTFTHKGLKDFARAAGEICLDVGIWAADWYIHRVVEQAKVAASPYRNVLSTWQTEEKKYLSQILDTIQLIPVSYEPQDIVSGSTAKVQILVKSLRDEIRSLESDGSDEDDELDDYSGIIFVTRRDTVLALSEVLTHHPSTADILRVGSLLGESDSAFRHSFLDITRKILRNSQEDTLQDFKIGEINLLVATSVAEEGLDIQSCRHVCRWDPPTNMVSWAQSRGRARRKRSTFTVLFDDSGVHNDVIVKMERMEHEMIKLYTNLDRPVGNNSDLDMQDEEDDNVRFYIESTGALLTTHSAIAHLYHFCSTLSKSAHATNAPLFDVDPPEMPEGWHLDRDPSTIPSYMGPWGSTVTLPRQLDASLRVYSTERIYTSKQSAHRHAAFNAYVALYKAGLLSEYLLPLYKNPLLEKDVEELKKEVGKRSGTAAVSQQIDPWAVDIQVDYWWRTEIVIEGLPPLHMFTQGKISTLEGAEAPSLYRSRSTTQVTVQSIECAKLSSDTLNQAREYTRRLFWPIYGGRMSWDETNFTYLFLPIQQNVAERRWDLRRSWLNERRPNQTYREGAFTAKAQEFVEEFGYIQDLTIIRQPEKATRLLRFVRWHYDALTPEQQESFFEDYPELFYSPIPYPLLAVQAYPKRMNFLIPFPAGTSHTLLGPDEFKTRLLPSTFASIELLSFVDTEYGILLPSVLRYIAMALTVNALRTELFSNSLLSSIPLDLLMTAITAPVAQESFNYQRLETLGDTVLKFIVSLQLLADHPFWHEGYLARKKDHAVSNFRLAKEAIRRGLYRWIIRDRMVPRKWKPILLADTTVTPTMEVEVTPNDTPEGHSPKKNPQQLSTKMLADVVESLIGAAYIHGAFDLAVDCAQIFDLGIHWEKIPVRVEMLLSRVENSDNFPMQVTHVEHMLGYVFKRKLLLVEALTHASYQYDLRTVSYERMEFLGDSILDMIVTDYLYRAPGKDYKPGHLHMRKSAVVNAHFLAFICLRQHRSISNSMPSRNERGNIVMSQNLDKIYLWQCLLHSSPRILEDQNVCFGRYQKYGDVIEEALQYGTAFPWATLTRLQAPKIFSDLVESLLGAVYLDSGGNLDTVRTVLRSLGILQTLERIVQDDVEVLHPVSRLSSWASKKQLEVKYNFKREDRNVTCILTVDGVEVARTTGKWRGKGSNEEVRFLAAEKAMKRLELREQDLDDDYDDYYSDQSSEDSEYDEYMT